MDNINFELIKVRVISFISELGSLLLVSLIGVPTSDSFQALVTQHFGETITTSVILLGVNGLIKHLRNVNTLDAYKEQLGAGNYPVGQKPPLPNFI